MAFTDPNESLSKRAPSRVAAIVTDSHFLIPLLVFCAGLTLLITLH